MPKKEPHDDNETQQSATFFRETEKDPRYLIEIIKAIECYYLLNKHDLEDGEEWKRLAGMAEKKIPEEVDELVKLAFIKQLKRYV